jgi:16S rRNA U1498 N3-methylase RsmE
MTVKTVTLHRTEWMKLKERAAEAERLQDILREIASQCHNLPRSATAERIEKLATGEP